jgi:AraC-like DNA-binding protein
LLPGKGATQFSCRHDTVGAEGFAVSRMRTLPAFGGATPGMNGLLAVVSVRAGHVSWDFGRRGEVDVGAGSTNLLPPFEEYTVANEQTDIDVIALDGPQVAAHAAHACGISPADFRFTGLVPISEPLARYWNATVAHLRDEVLNNPVTAASPILVDNAFELLAAALLSTFPNTALAATTDPAVRSPRGQVSEARLREVVDYLNTHAHRPIGPVTIAAIADAPAREVVEALRRRGTSPARRLRRARLLGAHRDLNAADPQAGTTVSTIAARWGYTHPARFRTAYTAAFDEQPEDTLQR